MREIKFRAWDTEYHYMYQNAYPFEHLVYVEMFDDDETFQQYKHKMMNVNGKWFYWIIAKDMALMQYTGLKDKNGKEVYEGDIVKGTTNEFGTLLEHIAQVEYDEYQVLQPFHNIWDYDANFWIDCLVGGFEVIGNIYEHSELLEKESH